MSASAGQHGETRPASPLDFLIIDADHHYYEPDDCFTRHIESAYADRAVNIRRGEAQFGRVYIGDQRMRFFSIIPGDHTGVPGAPLRLHRNVRYRDLEEAERDVFRRRWKALTGESL